MRSLVHSPKSRGSRTFLAVGLFCVSFAIPIPGHAENQRHDCLLRFPTISSDRVAFVAGGDIWTAPLRGGVAERLTINDGEESFPRLSPDGSRIAFTGQYDGNTDVYVMDVHGGSITRLTYHPGADQVLGWCVPKHKILFSSTRNSFNRFTRLFLISPDGSGLEEVPLPEAAQGSFSPDGRKIAYCKVSVDDRTWKRYRGGRAPDIYIFDLETKQEQNITNSDAIDSNPMWVGDKVYFTSDRDRVLNLWAYDTRDGKLDQLTRFTARDYDVRRPSTDGTRIVYELGGDLYAYDTATRENGRIPIEVRADAPELRPCLKKVDAFVSDADCSPDGKAALVVARGDLFTVPRKEGLARNLTRTCGAHEKDAAWSPDGKTIAYFSDSAGEYDLYTMDAAGLSGAQRLTTFADGYRHALRWSPDGKKIGFTDQTLTLYSIDVATRKLTKIDKAEVENVDISLDRKDIYDYCWSPDSRFIAYAKMDESLVSKIYICALETGSSRCVSDGAFNDFHPVFSKDGEHLFFVSNRRFDPTFCDFEWEMVYKKNAGIYGYTLKKDGPPLFPPVPADGAGRAVRSGSKGEKDKVVPVSVTIDFDGLTRRIESFPLPRGNYRFLAVNDDAVFYLNTDEGDFNRFEFREVGPRDLCAFSFKDKKSRTVVAGIDDYRLSRDGSTVLYRKGREVGMIDASEKEAKGEAISLTDLKIQLDPLAEWRQIFNEAWRMERDLYYEPNLHGIDWPAMRAKYGRMLERATCRQDVRYVIGELIGELNSSHTYVFGGDVRREAEQVGVGLLGADYEIDPVSRLYRFKKLYGEVDWNTEERPPLAGPGIPVNAGDYLLKVNGIDVTADRSVFSYFTDLAGKPVELVVNDKPTPRGARTVVVKPVASDYTLRYMDWVEGNRRFVDKESGGAIGYIHLPDTFTGSAALFPRYFYSQTAKQGIIVDGRFNGGGLDPDIFLQRLGKKSLDYWARRSSHDQATPWLGTNALLVCITNRQAGSGGDELPFIFREKGMGPVIGTRTWGGLIGYSTEIPLIDGGTLTAPDERVYDRQGQWVVENEGVTPDIVVDLDPADFGTGRDAQLSKALAVLKARIQKEGSARPKHPAYPVDK